MRAEATIEEIAEAEAVAGTGVGAGVGRGVGCAQARARTAAISICNFGVRPRCAAKVSKMLEVVSEAGK